jgi:hypothetical protein
VEKWSERLWGRTRLEDPCVRGSMKMHLSQKSAGIHRLPSNGSGHNHVAGSYALPACNTRYCQGSRLSAGQEIPCSEQPATRPYLKPDEESAHNHVICSCKVTVTTFPEILAFLCRTTRHRVLPEDTRSFLNLPGEDRSSKDVRNVGTATHTSCSQAPNEGNAFGPAGRALQPHDVNP